MTREERSAAARHGAAVRWHTATLKATHGSDDHPLRVGDIAIRCYVLEDGTRVLSQRGLQTGIGMSSSGGLFGAQRVAGFITSLAEKGIDVKDLPARISRPIAFKAPGIGFRSSYPT